MCRKIPFDTSSAYLKYIIAMRRFLYILLLLPLATVAQTKFGYFNYSEVLRQLPQYESVKADYDDLLKRCDDEIKRNEQELTRSYVAFLDGQRDFPEPILRKRQKELQDLVDRSVVFRDEVKKWLAHAYDSLFTPLYATVDDAVSRVCVHNNLDYAIDLEKAGYVFVNPARGFDITNAVLGTIKLLGEPQRVIATDGVPVSSAERAASSNNNADAENNAEDESAESEDSGESIEQSKESLH